MSGHVLTDCLDAAEGLPSLPDKSIDVVCTDPPYGEHVHYKSVRGQGHKPGGRLQALGFDHLTLETMQAAAVQFGRLARRWVLVFSDMESGHLWRAALEAGGLEYVRAGIWVKEHPTPQMTGDRPAIGVELITIAHPPGRKRWNGGGKPAVWTCSTAYRDGDHVVHTTQKPLALMESLMADFTDPGDLVLDPFAGVATTGVAAKRLGRGFIGFEKDPAYHAIGLKRLDAAREQLGLFTGKRASKAKQLKIGVEP